MFFPYTTHIKVNNDRYVDHFALDRAEVFRRASLGGEKKGSDNFKQQNDKCYLMN